MNSDAFENYRKLLRNVDAFSAHIFRIYRIHMMCRFGCTQCCKQQVSLFPVEFNFLREGFNRLPHELRSTLTTKAAQDNQKKGICLLLCNEGCLLYEYRPIICRTHGLPLYITEADEERRGCCPKNFAAYPLPLIPKSDLLHLERLNTILITVNKAFAARANVEAGTRIPVTQLVIKKRSSW